MCLPRDIRTLGHGAKIQEYWGVFEKDRKFLKELGSQEPPSHSEQFLPLKLEDFTNSGGRVVDRGLLWSWMGAQERRKEVPT